MSFKSNSFIAAVAAMSWCVAPAALSQEPPPEDPTTSSDLSNPPQSPSTSQDVDQGAPAAQPSAPPATVDASSLDDKKIDQFADAFLAVQTIQQKAAADLQSATDPAAADKVKTAAETDMIAAVERSGLQVDEFNQIVQSMASNMEVRNRVAAKLQERSGG
ncbi:MAG: DUF4168 domain-containing protein [Steroidobacter sp.]